LSASVICAISSLTLVATGAVEPTHGHAALADAWTLADAWALADASALAGAAGVTAAIPRVTSTAAPAADRKAADFRIRNVIVDLRSVNALRPDGKPQIR
jgi:hypothetical protein